MVDLGYAFVNISLLDLLLFKGKKDVAKGKVQSFCNQGSDERVRTRKLSGV